MWALLVLAVGNIKYTQICINDFYHLHYFKNTNPHFHICIYYLIYMIYELYVALQPTYLLLAVGLMLVLAVGTML
jgi:hypothetical protein